jgi:hypothetical protein
MILIHKDKWNINLDIIKYPLRKNLSLTIDFKAKYISVELWNIQTMVGYYNWNRSK